MNTKPSDLVFVGIKGSIVALDRSSGQQVWAAHLKGSDFVNVVVQNGVILASCHGEVYCLDPLTGNGLWHNPLKGFGLGLVTIATEGNVEGGNVPLMAERLGRDETAVVAASVAVVAASG
jgi:outer membrane protein assembly factor BamB